MPESLNRVVIDRVDWKSVLPVLRLASVFKHALQPGKLIVALLAVLAIHFSGTVLDLIWGDQASEYYSEPTGAFGERDAGIYKTFIDDQSYALEALLWSTIHLQPWQEHGEGGMLEALQSFTIGHPVEYATEYPWFMLIFGIDVLFILAIASGILCRMSSTQVCANRSTGLGSAACFVRKRWVWYWLTPLMPAMLIAVVGAILALAGLVFFSVPVVDVVGALLYGVLLLLGFVVAVVALLLLFALCLMPPALSVEGSDGFDAIARSFNYIIFRPWQFAIYLFSSILYLAGVYVLVGTVASLSIDATRYFVGLGVIGDAESTEAASWMMSRWFELVTAIVTAILFSTLCCLQTQVYVLMRRSADGTPMDQCDFEEPANLWQDCSPAAAATEATVSDDEPKAKG